MFKFNNENIFTGYIKQLLASFNLPKYRVYTKEQHEWHENYLEAQEGKSHLTAIIDELTSLNAEISALPENSPQESTLLKRVKALEEEAENINKKIEKYSKPELNILESNFRDNTIKYSPKAARKPRYPKRMRYIPYIKEGVIQIYAPMVEDGKLVYSNNDWKSTHAEYGNEHKQGLHKNTSHAAIPQDYVYNLKVRNYTKNLKITNNVYDTYTHEYLGDYLRFIRDYKQINLMPLYNCFSNNVCPELDIKLPQKAWHQDAAAATPTLDDGEFYTFDTIADFKDFLLTLDYETNIFEVTELPETTPLGYLTFEFNNKKYSLTHIEYQVDTSTEDLEVILPAGYTVADKNYVIIETYEQWGNNTWDETYTAKFDTTDPKYKIYMVPVKLFKHYTIAMDSENAVEMCCGLFGQYPYEEEKYLEIPAATYTCYNSMQFNNPVLFTAIDNLTDFASILHGTELAQHEDDLKLFIKVPINNTSSIVVLEGDYCEWNNYAPSIIQWNEETKILKKQVNHTVINFEHDVEKLGDKLVTPLQLLMANTQESYPFADRLVEYLVGNVITPEDEIGDNIKRAKVVARKNTDERVLTIVEDEIWLPAIRYVFYNYMNKKYSSKEINHDLLGYVDMDVEKFFAYANTYIRKINGVPVAKTEADSIATVNIYETWEEK